MIQLRQGKPGEGMSYADELRREVEARFPQLTQAELEERTLVWAVEKAVWLRSLDSAMVCPHAKREPHPSGRGPGRVICSGVCPGEVDGMLPSQVHQCQLYSTARRPSEAGAGGAA